MNIGTNINFLLSLQIQMKINHWQTKGLSRHKAFGKFYDTLSKLIDSFVESAMGKYGRFTLDEETKTIQLNNLSELDMRGLVNTVRESFILMTDQLDPTDTDLLNIRDEMLGELNKLNYLLTLE
jgi:DNA-binding ferritin-like protein